MKSYLEFEHDIKVLEEELERLKDPFKKDGLTEVETGKIIQIQTEIDDKLKTSYANLNEWQKTQVARHEERPKAKFFIENLFKILLIYLETGIFQKTKQYLLGLLNLKVDQF